MTTTKRITMLLSDGKSRKAEQMAKELDLDVEEIRRAIESLRNNRFVQSSKTYELTKKGVDRAKAVPLAAEMKEPKARPLLNRGCRMEKFAIDSMPALSRAWGFIATREAA